MSALHGIGAAGVTADIPLSGGTVLYGLVDFLTLVLPLPCYRQGENPVLKIGEHLRIVYDLLQSIPVVQDT